ncbi:MAG: four helix bundle protein, partial [Verrucomicrobiae bacterium]|nr:four helix bundle protein [Verrucomicrobiae bacterium]
MPGPFIPDHGGYRNLLSFQKARIVYDGTVRFCERFLSRRDRTFDQMVQAARSGKQNIVEGSLASGTSKETEIKLTNVARASLEELPEDYRDFLRVRGIPEWTKESPYTQRLRQLTRTFHSLAGCEVSGLCENRAIATGWDGDARSKTPFFEITNCWP